MEGVVGEKVKFAVVGGSVVETLIVREDVDVARASLVTESVTVNVPPRIYRCVVVTPVPVCPSPKSQLNVPLLTVDEEPLNETSWLMVGLVGENVNREIVAPVLGKSSASKDTYVEVFAEMVIGFSLERAPVLVSRAVNVTSACGVGGVPFEKTFAFDSGSFSVNDPLWPAATWPI